MSIFFCRRQHMLLLALPLLSIVLLAGCGTREPIQSYTVPKVAEETTTDSADPAEAAESAEADVAPATGEPTDRMLAAVLPVGNRAWFFKVVGPIEAVGQREEEIDKFFSRIQLADDGRATWELPAGDWKEEQGTGMRAATIWIPTGDKPLELSVIPLPWRGAPGEMLSNVNRWRGQLKLPEANQEQLAEFTREIESGDATVTIVDLRGRFDAGPMMAPFARGARGQAPQLPPGHPPVGETITPERDGATNGDR